MMIAIAYDEADTLYYVSEWFKKDTYLNAYQFVVKPAKESSYSTQQVKRVPCCLPWLEGCLINLPNKGRGSH